MSQFLIWIDDDVVMNAAEVLDPDWSVEAASPRVAVDKILGDLRDTRVQALIVFDGETWRHFRLKTAVTFVASGTSTLTALMGGEAEAPLHSELRRLLSTTCSRGTP